MDHTAIVKERPLMPRTAGHSFWRREKEGIMKRRILPILVTGALMAVGATPAFGDTGPPGPPVDIPGTTYPEGTNVQRDGIKDGCHAITTNPGTMLGGVFDQHVPTFVDDQTTALLVDACFGG
jgi:hypothetical protein